MRLSGKQFEDVQEALLDAFPSRDSLEIMVRIELDEELETIATGGNLRSDIFKLLVWAESVDRVSDLIQGALRQNPGNHRLSRVVQESHAHAGQPKLPARFRPVFVAAVGIVVTASILVIGTWIITNGVLTQDSTNKPTNIQTVITTSITPPISNTPLANPTIPTSESPDVIQIRASDCEASPGDCIQTGFMVSDRRGILTTLRGVVDCRSINGFTIDGKYYQDLKLIEADIDTSMAMLSSIGLLESVGRPQLKLVSDTANITSTDTLHAYSYPNGIRTQIRSDSIRIQKIAMLESLVPMDILRQFAQLNSPSPHTEVLLVSHRFQPGEAGAPVLNEYDEVVGIVLGGHEDLGWVTPIDRVHLVPVDAIEKQLSELIVNLDYFYQSY